MGHEKAQTAAGVSCDRVRQIGPSVSVRRVLRPAGHHRWQPEAMLLSFSLRPHARAMFLSDCLRRSEAPVSRGECCFIPRGKGLVLQTCEAIDCLDVCVEDAAWSPIACGFGASSATRGSAGGADIRLGLVDPLLCQFSTLLLQELETERPGTDVLAGALVNALLVRFLRLCTTEPAPGMLPNFPTWKVNLVRRYVDENIARELPLVELASLTRMSPFHFSRVFKQATGQSPHSFIVHRRLVAARIMLAADTFSIAEVAFRSGYGSQAHFKKLFVRHFGMTPRMFRQQSLDGLTAGPEV